MPPTRQLVFDAVVLVLITGMILVFAQKGVLGPLNGGFYIVALTGTSMEPGFKTGDALFYSKINSKDPIRAGEIILFRDGSDKVVCHRVIEVHEMDTNQVYVLTKGDNNYWDDRHLYAQGQLWLQRHHILGRALGSLPYVGWVELKTGLPTIKFLLLVLTAAWGFLTFL